MLKKMMMMGFVVFYLGSGIQAQEGSLSICQSIQDRIDYYQRLRRKGGSTQQMERWKKNKRVQEKKFARLKCKNWRSELK